VPTSRLPPPDSLISRFSQKRIALHATARFAERPLRMTSKSEVIDQSG
jgi:hypothetical protein